MNRYTSYSPRSECNIVALVQFCDEQGRTPQEGQFVPRCVIDRLNDFEDAAEKLNTDTTGFADAIARLIQERDAAICDLRKTRSCSTCGKRKGCDRHGIKKANGKGYCFDCWTWRGPCEKNMKYAEREKVNQIRKGEKHHEQTNRT